MILNEISLARLCQRVYREAYESYDEYSEFDEAIPIVSGSAEAMVLIKGDAMIVVVRGTEIDEVADLLTIMNGLFSVRHKLGPVHRGFSKYYERLLTGVMTLCSVHKPKRIICAGHSLGGAIATLLAGSLRRVSEDVTLFTIGSPRVGKKQFAEAMIREIGEKCYQFVIDTDIVTHLPPRCWPFGYQRLTAGYKLDVDITAVHRGIASITFACLRRLVGVPPAVDRPVESLMRRLGLSFISDHSTDSYIRGLVKLAEERQQEGRGPMIQIHL